MSSRSQNPSIRNTLALANFAGTVSTAAVKDVVDTSLETGAISIAELHKMGIRTKDLEDPTERFPEDRLIELWRFLEVEKGIEFGLTVGGRINLNAKGLLASWVSQAANLGEAFELFRSHIPLMNPSESWEYSEIGGLAKLTLKISLEKAYPSIASVRSMAAAVTWARALTGKALNLRSLCFDFDKPSKTNEFESLFGTNISFGMPDNSFIFEASELSHPILSGNAFLKAEIEQRIREVLTRSTDFSIEARVVKAIESSLEFGLVVTADEVARRLAMSRQTLYRKLKEADTDFKSLLEVTRKELAAEYLRDSNAPIHLLIERLGFKDSSGFNKAFRRWFGCSPREYRQDNKQQ